MEEIPDIDASGGSVDVLFVCALPEEFEAARDVATNGFLEYPGVARWAQTDEFDTTEYQRGRL